MNGVSTTNNPNTPLVKQIAAYVAEIINNLSLPELEPKVVKGGKERSNKSTTPEPQIKCRLLGRNFFRCGRRRTIFE